MEKSIHELKAEFAYLISNNIIEGIKAVWFFFFLTKKDGTSKLVKVSSYIPTFTNLLSPSDYADLLVPQINCEF